MSVCNPVFLVHPLKSQNVEIPAFRLKPLKRPVLLRFLRKMIKLPKGLLTIFLHPKVVEAGRLASRPRFHPARISESQACG
jgi:hypothetical protein